MKKYAKDMFLFGGSSIMLGASSTAVGALGGGSGYGLAAASSMMSPVASVMTMGHMVRMSGKALDVLPKPKRRLKNDYKI